MNYVDYGSVCSGVEAASLAWEPIGWKPAWFAEIEPFPSAVLAHHWPRVPNLGDMTTIAARVRAGEIQAPSVLVGGTPCQAFSVAGLRQSLDDDRGQLTLRYMELANAIDDVRRDRGEPESIIVWENVPGCLNTADNAFGCFLAGLAGESEPLQPSGKRWTNAGCVFGPQRTIAWRVLDAQYLGVAQRRRRVFVVASARNGFDPCAVLFESEGVRRDTAPSREAGQDAAADAGCGFETAGTLESRTTAGGFPGTDGACAGHVVPEGCWWDGGKISQTLDAVLYKGQTMPEKNRFPAVLEPVQWYGCNECGEVYQDQHARELDTTLQELSSEGAQGRKVLHDMWRQAQGAGPMQSPLHSTEGGQAFRVRRLTPREAERLQGMPDDHTLVPYGRATRPEKLDADYLKYLLRGNPKGLTREECARLASDGPRYKAIGNSMAVPCMSFIGRRIDAQITG